MSGAAARLVERMREEGVARTAAFVLRNPLGVLRGLVDVERLVLVAQDTASRPDAQGAPAGVVVRRGVIADVAALQAFSPELRCARQLAAGDLVVLAESDGAIVGCRWLTRRPTRMSLYRVAVRPGPREAYAYGLRVDRASRRRGVGSALVRAGLDAAREDGVDTVISYISLRNPGSPRILIDAVGGVPRGEALVLVLLGRVGIPLRRRAA